MVPPDNSPAPLATTVPTDPWTHLRKFTAARIALGRTGGSQTTRSVLDFKLSHARARDAVQKNFEVDKLMADFAASGLETCLLSSEVTERKTHLLRPDLGRTLSTDSKGKLQELAKTFPKPLDLVIILSDGLAASAAERHALPTILALLSHLNAADWKLPPIIVVPFARVKIQDQIGQLLGAAYSLMLLGERPGLGTPDSLGAYFTAKPGPACTDADRNCLSNIRPEGLPPAQAAAKLAWLLLESSRTGLSGIHLKDTEKTSRLDS